MKEFNWNFFEVKFNGKQESAFERLATSLFYKKFNITEGVLAHKNQIGIETEPIFEKGEWIGFQAKYIDPSVKLSERKSKFIDSIIKTKNQNPHINVIYFYVNKSFSESKIEGQKSPKYIQEIESKATELDVSIVWQLKGQIETQLSNLDNKSLENEFFPKYIEQDSMSNDEIDMAINRLNSHFTSVKQYFGNDKELKINRQETDEIYSWLNKTLESKEKNLAIIAGNAGLGKSVIISQLIEKLSNENKIVVALKADRFNVESHEALKAKIELPISFSSFISSILSEKKELVLIIDQIDALSQSISTNMKSLHVFDDIIQKYLGKDNVRIVVSCWTFDLNYDPLLKKYSGKNVFKTKELSDNQVSEILSQHNLKNVSGLTKELKSLLKIPLHLDIFIEIYSTELKISQFNSIQDLYNELWNKKLINPSNFDSGLQKEKVIELVYSLAERMFENQEINSITIPFQDKYTNELRYIESTSLVKCNNRFIEFFHQSFLEYVVARKFVFDQTNITQDIKKKHQGLFLRSKIQQILNYKRNVDPDSYIQDLKDLVKDHEIRYHIKALTLQLVAFQESPSNREVSFVKGVFGKYVDIKELFISYYHGVGWLDVFIDNDWIQELINSTNKNLNNLVGLFLRRQSKINKQKLLDFFHENKTNSNFKEYIINFLWSIGEFDDIKFIQLLENVFPKENNEEYKFSLFYILKHTIKNYPEWLSKFLYNNYPINLTFDDFDNHLEFFPGSSNNSDLYSDFWEIHPRISYELVKKITLKTIDISTNKSNKPESFATISKAFLMYTDKEDHLYFHHKQLKSLYEYLIEDFENEMSFVKSETLSFIDCEKPNIHKFMIGLKVMNAFPSEFKDELLNIYRNPILLKSLIGPEQYMTYLIYNTFGKVYRFWSSEEKRDVNDVILNFYPDYELKKFNLGEGQEFFNKNHGRSMFNFLNELESNEIKHERKLKSRYNELKRKFGKAIKRVEPQGFVSISGGNVLPVSAYENMSIEDWKKSFLKYDENSSDYNSWKNISELEHSRIFSQKVSEKPVEFISLVENIINDTHIPNSYVLKGIEGIINSNIDRDRITYLIKRLIKIRKLDSYQNTQLLWLIQKLVKNRIYEVEIFNFVISLVEYGSESKTIQDDVLTSGVNSERGAAVYTLMDFSFNKDKHKVILNKIKEISPNSDPSVRACALIKLANFLKYSREDTFETFKLLISDYSIGLVKLSPQLLAYSQKAEFIDLKNFYSKAILIPEASEAMGQLLTRFYCFNYEGADKLMDDFINQNEENAEPVINIAWKFIQSHVKGDLNNEIIRAITLIHKFLDTDNSKVASSYRFPFYHLEVHHFSILKEFLFEYVDSTVGKYREDSFYLYLAKCTKEFPEECISLASKFENHIDFNTKDRVLRNEPLNVIISAYNQIREYDKSDSAIENAMDVFDGILKNSKLRDSAFDVLEKLEY